MGVDRRGHLFNVRPTTMIHPELFKEVSKLEEDPEYNWVDPVVTATGFETFNFPALSQKFCRDIKWFSDLTNQFQIRDEFVGGTEVPAKSLSEFLNQVLLAFCKDALVPVVQYVWHDYSPNYFEISIRKITSEAPSVIHHDKGSVVNCYIPLTDGGIEFPGMTTSSVNNQGVAIVFPGQLTHLYQEILGAKQDPHYGLLIKSTFAVS